ncbi:MAG: HTTM domain-containing protein [Planctomycetota bacterium]
MHLWRATTEFLYRPVDVASQVAFRILFGILMLVEVYRYFTNGWIERYFVEPDFHFTYYGFGWVTPWPGDGMYWHFVGLGLLAIAVALGFCYRLAATLLFLGFTYVFLLDQANYLNHFYLIALVSFLMIFVPAHRDRSLDAVRKPGLRSEVVPAWSLWLLRFQIGVPYFFGGVAKLNADWLRGEPIRTWLAERVEYPLVGRFFDEEWCVQVFAYGGLLLDLLVVPLLLWRRTRWVALGFALFFHGMNSWLFGIGVFPWFMIAGTTLFLDPDWPRRALFLIGPRTSTVDEVSSSNTGRAFVVVLLAAWVVFQVVVPLRHFSYDGSVHWTEDGHRFSWHMMLRSKSSSLTFRVVAPARGRTWELDEDHCRQYLSRRQYEKMTTRPDMILQFAHRLAREFAEPARGPVEVYGTALVSLNGRPPQPMIDSTVDLAREPRSLEKPTWILPLTTPLPGR